MSAPARTRTPHLEATKRQQDAGYGLLFAGAVAVLRSTARREFAGH